MATNQSGPTRQATENCNLDDSSRFTAWENEIACELAGNVSLESLASWGGRVTLGDMLRPDDFNGSLRQIEIEPMEDAFTELAAARKKENALSADNFTRPAADLSDIDPSHLRGFWIWATATSSAQGGPLSPIMASVWYHFTPGVERKRQPKSPVDPDGPDVQRFVGNLLTNEVAFREVCERSCRIGTRLLQDGLQHPIPVPMGNDGRAYRRDLNYRRAEDRRSVRHDWHYSDSEH